MKRKGEQTTLKNNKNSDGNSIHQPKCQVHIGAGFRCKSRQAMWCLTLGNCHGPGQGRNNDGVAVLKISNMHLQNLKYKFKKNPDTSGPL